MRRARETFATLREDGIPAFSIDEVLEPHRDLIDRIRVCHGVDHTTFERELFSLIRRYAEFVHLLPATPDNYFRAPGGLFRLGLEVAFFSLQGTDGHIFSGRSTISTRRHLEPRWRYATFIAGLCCELHRALTHVVVAGDDGADWQPYLFPLSAWLDRQRTSRFFPKWLPHVAETRALAVFALPHVISAEVLQDLASGNSIVVPHMMASISGIPSFREHNILDGLVRRSVALVIDRDLRARADGHANPQRAAHLDRYLVDALRRLIRENPAWKPNTDKSRLWFGSDGLYLVWPGSATDIQKLLQRDQLAGFPNGSDAILEMLIAAGVCEARDDASKTWEICPPGTSS